MGDKTPLRRTSTAFTLCCSTLLALVLFEASNWVFPREHTLPRSGFQLSSLARPKPLPAIDHAWGSILRPFEKEIEPHSVTTYALPSLDSFAGANRQKVRVLLAIAELSGLHKNGGIGTAYRALAESMSQEGFNVTVLMLHAKETFPGFVVRHMGQLMKKQNITLEYLPSMSSSAVGTFPSDWSTRMSLHLHDYLLTVDGEYDVVHFHDNHGHGYHTLLAKQQGQAFKNMKFIIGMHGPNTGWATLLNGEFPAGENPLITDHLERRSCEMADAVVAPSEYILNYLLLRGWKLPKTMLVVWNLAGGGQDLAELENNVVGETPIDNIVFYGRLEGRKGIRVFLAAMDELAEQGVPGFTEQQPLTISFLGRDTIDSDGTSTKAIIEKHGRKWAHATGSAIQFKLVTGKNREGALAYLKEPGSLAVMPSLIDNSPYTVMECIAYGVDFIASAVGGIPELVDPKDHQHVLFQPNPAALAKKLQQKLADNKPRPAIRPPHAFSDSTKSWISLHLDLYSQIQHDKSVRRGTFFDAPSQSTSAVCILYDGRFTDTPTQLLDTLHSVAMQSITPAKVVIYANLPSDYPQATAQDYAHSIITITSHYQWEWKDMTHLPSPLTHCAQETEADHVLLLRAGHLLHPEALVAFTNVTEKGGYDVVSSSVATIQGPGAFSEDCATGKSKVCKMKTRDTYFGDALSVGLISQKLGADSFMVRRKALFASAKAPIKHHFDPSSAAWEFYVRFVSEKRPVTMISHTYLAKREKSPKDKPVPSFAMNNWLHEYQAFSPLLDQHIIADTNMGPFLMYAKGLVQSHIRPAVRPIAHSKDDFSSFQGYHGWTYSFQDFQKPFSRSRDPAFYHGDSWQHPDVVDGLLFVSKEGMHPYKSSKENLIYGPVRSWASPAVLDDAILKLDYEGFHHCGDGTEVKVIMEDTAQSTFTDLYSAETFDAGPISWTTHLNLTDTMVLHLVIDPKLNSDCDHVNAVMHLLPPGRSTVGPAKEQVPVEVLRQRHSRTLTDTANNFALHTYGRRPKEEYKAELSKAFAWKYRFIDVNTGEVVPGVFNKQATSARIKDDMEVPYVAEHAQHPTSRYIASRYATIGLPPGNDYEVQLTAAYPKGFCETYCGDGAMVELLVDGELRVNQPLEMTSSLRKVITLPRDLSKVDLDLRVVAGKDDWFDAVDVHLKVLRV